MTPSWYSQNAFYNYAIRIQELDICQVNVWTCWVVNVSKLTTTYCLFLLLLLWKLLALLTMMMTRKEKSTKEWRDGTTNFKEHRAHNSCSEAEASPTNERVRPSNLLKLSNATNAIAATSKDDDVEYKGDHSNRYITVLLLFRWYIQSI